MSKQNKRKDNLNMNIFRGKKDMKLLVVVVLGVLVFGCAYDPVADGEDSKPEFHAVDQERGIDLVVNSSLVLSGVPDKIGRLIFLQDAVLSTDGADLKLVVDEIVSHNGKISTLPKSTKPELGAAGLSGGSLHIEARTGKGHLTILAEGQDGGEGIKGTPGSIGPKGPRGNNGEAGYELDCLLSSPIKLLFNLDRPDPPRCFKRWYCKRQTGDGGRGGQGARGHVGGAGANGGDSAKVFVHIEDPSELSISTEIHVGQGGAGGQGGDGGRGGVGGDGGSQDNRKECRGANSGPEGPHGPKGPQGPRGFDADAGPICLVLGSAKIGECDHFKGLTQ